MPIFGAAYAAPNNDPTILYWFRSILRKSWIQQLFKALQWFSSTFQGIFSFQRLFKKALYIQVLFKPVRPLVTCVSGISWSYSLSFSHDRWGPVYCTTLWKFGAKDQITLAMSSESGHVKSTSEWTDHPARHTKLLRALTLCNQMLQEL